MKNTGFERYSSRAKVDYQAKSWLKLSTNLAYTHYDSNYSVTNVDDYNATSSANIFYVANFMAPIYPLYIRDAQGNIMKDSHGYTMYDFGDASWTRTLMLQMYLVVVGLQKSICMKD